MRGIWIAERGERTPSQDPCEHNAELVSQHSEAAAGREWCDGGQDVILLCLNGDSWLNAGVLAHFSRIFKLLPFPGLTSMER